MTCWIGLAALVPGAAGCKDKRRAEPGRASAASLRWKLTASTSLVYRLQLKQRPGDLDGTISVDGTGPGHAWISLPTLRSIFVDYTHFELTPEANSIFPRPPARPKTVRSYALWDAFSEASGKVTEVVRAGRRTEDLLELSWVRKLYVPKQRGNLWPRYITQRGRGAFDLKHGRYHEVTFKQELRHKEGAAVVERAALEAKLDLAASAKRAKERARTAARARAAQQSYGSYLKSHDVVNEVRSAVNASITSAPPRPTHQLHFHLAAHPDQVWREGLANFRSDTDQRAFLRLMEGTRRAPSKLPDSVSDLIKKYVATSPALRSWVAGVADRRLEVPLQMIVAGLGGAVARAEGLPKTAKATLARLAKPGHLSAKELIDVVDNRPTELRRTLFTRDWGADHERSIPALIEVLERKQTSEAGRDVLVELLELFTSRRLGQDPKAWHSYWSANKDRPQSARMVEAAKTAKDPRHRALAFGALGRVKPTRAGLRLLLSDLRSPRPLVQSAAACALASWGDGRAVPTLLRHLGHPQRLFRYSAYGALSSFHGTTLGYDPEADAAGRAEAIGRWRGWAADAKLGRVKLQGR